MHMNSLDWIILGVCIGSLTWFSLRTVRYMRGVADFLSANRSAGRFLLTMASGMSGLGAISMVGLFEMYYAAGFPPAWWTLMFIPAGIAVTLTGWMIYRYRETRCMTLAQFFEVRYSKRFRIYSGIITWICGVVRIAVEM